MSISPKVLTRGSDLILKTLQREAELQKVSLRIQIRLLELKNELVFGGEFQ